MTINQYIKHWANLIRESSDNFTSSKLLDEKDPAVNEDLGHHCEKSSRAGGHSQRPVALNRIPGVREATERNKEPRTAHIITYSDEEIIHQIRKFKNGDIHNISTGNIP